MASKFGAGSAALKEASKGANFSKTVYFSLEDGETAYVRFLTDYELPLIPDGSGGMVVAPGMEHVEAWPEVLQHQGIPTRPKPDFAKEGSRWPDRFGVVCRNTKCKGLPGEPLLWTRMEDKDERQGCYVCEEMQSKEGKPYRATARGWALGCLREEIRGDGSEKMGGPLKKGKVVGYKDITREVEKDGKTITEKAVVVFNMGYKNFFSSLDGYGQHHGTILDRDYKITREGEGTSTDYRIIAMDPVPGPNGDIYDLRIKEYMDRYDIGLSLEDEIDSQARDSWHRRWFDPSYTPPKKDDDSKDGGSSKADGPSEAAQEKASNDVTDEGMAAMAGRVLGRYNADESEAPADDEGQPDASAAEEETPAAAGAATGLQFIE